MDSVRQFYNSYKYPVVNLYTNRQRKHNNKLMDEILECADLCKEDLHGLRVLDAGCGTGVKSVFMAKQGARVTAIDFSEGQLKEAKLNALKNKVNIVFVHKDLIKDDLSDLRKFDLVICTGVLHHTESAKQSFAKLARLLKPTGSIILGLYHKYSRFRYRILRLLVRTQVSSDPAKIIKWLQNSWIAKPIAKAPLATLYDRYCVPFESYHTLSEVKRWFKENDIDFVGHSSNVKGLEPFRLFENKTIFFVSGKQK